MRFSKQVGLELTHPLCFCLSIKNPQIVLPHTKSE